MIQGSPLDRPDFLRGLCLRKIFFALAARLVFADHAPGGRLPLLFLRARKLASMFMCLNRSLKMRGGPTSHPVRILELADFPWLVGAGAEQISDVQRPSAEHLYWPALDIDLAVAVLRDPAAFPLIAKT